MSNIRVLSTQNQVLPIIRRSVFAHYDKEENSRVHGSYEEYNVQEVQRFIDERRRINHAYGNYTMSTYFYVMLQHSTASHCVLQDMKDLMLYHVLADNEPEKLVLDKHLFNIIMRRY